MNVVFSIEATEQILNFGGPWVGKLKVGEIAYHGKFLDQDIILDANTQVIYVAKFIDYGYFRWQVHFKIMAINLNTNKAYISKRKFKALCLKSAFDNILKFHENFCEGVETEQRTIEFSNDNFVPI